jgi:glycosyltransferase involved in cell wall biosynthesis
MSKIIIIEGDINNAINGFRKKLVSTLSDSNELIIIGSTTKKNFKLPENSKNLKYYNLGDLSGNPILYIIYILKIYIIILIEKPKISISFNLRPNIAIGLIRKVHLIKTISTITGTSTFLNTSNFFKRSVLKFIFLDIDYVFFQNISDKLLFDNQKIKINNHIIVPGSGIDTSVFDFKRSYKFLTETKFILISRIIKEKGILEYIKAAEIIKKNGYDAKFSLLGPFYLSGKVSDRIDKSIIFTAVQDNIIEYLGETNNVIPYILNSDCVVLPSYREGMSNLLLEAASLCTPIITSNVPGCKEIVENNYNGYLCSPMNSSDLAEKLIKFIKLSEREREIMGRNGRIKIKNEFEKSLVVNEYLRIVNLLAN